MFCTKCGTQYPDNGSCPNCSGGDNFFKSAGSLDDSMDMEIPSPQAYAEPQPQDYAESQPQAYTEPQPQAYAEPQPQAYTEPQPQAYAEPQPQAYAEPQPQAFAPDANAQYANNNMYNEPPVNTSYASAPPYTGVAPTAPSGGSKGGFIVQIIIAICMFVSMFVLPITPNVDEDATFGNFYIEFFENIDVADEMFEMIGDADGIIGAIYSSTIIMAFGFLIASVLLLIFTLIRNKTMSIVSSILGILALLSPIILVAGYGMSEGLEINGDFFEYIFEAFGAGVWIPVVLFIVHIIVTACTKKR